jgi:signal peptidase II
VRTKLTTFGLISVTVLVLDFVTKRWALDALGGGRRIDLFGGLVPLTLAFNKGAAFGMAIGEDSRWFFVPVTIVALVLLVALFRRALPGDHLRHVALSLVIAGALGNLWDRVRWHRGVVDFIGPLDLGFWDFPIFNVADMGITCGAILLAISFWLEEERERKAGREPSPPSPGTNVA